MNKRDFIRNVAANMSPARTIDEANAIQREFGTFSKYLTDSNLYASDVCDPGDKRPYHLSATDLKRQFDRFNRAYFGNRLPKDVKVRLYCFERSSLARTMIQYRLIEFNSRYDGKFTKYEILNALIHEMTHYFMHVLYLDRDACTNERLDNGLTAHNGCFAYLLRRLDDYGWNVGSGVYTNDPRDAEFGKSPHANYGQLTLRDFIGIDSYAHFKEMLLGAIFVASCHSHQPNSAFNVYSSDRKVPSHLRLFGGTDGEKYYALNSDKLSISIHVGDLYTEYDSLLDKASKTMEKIWNNEHLTDRLLRSRSVYHQAARRTMSQTAFRKRMAQTTFCERIMKDGGCVPQVFDVIIGLIDVSKLYESSVSNFDDTTRFDDILTDDSPQFEQLYNEIFSKSYLNATPEISQNR